MSDKGHRLLCDAVAAAVRNSRGELCENTLKGLIDSLDVDDRGLTPIPLLLFMALSSMGVDRHIDPEVSVYTSEANEWDVWQDSFDMFCLRQAMMPL